MTSARRSKWWLAALCFAIGARVAAQQTPEQVTVPFSDPSRPGMLTVVLVEGGITVKGVNRKDVLIVARAGAENNSLRGNPEAAGLRRLTPAAGFQVGEHFNEMSISSHPTRHVDFEIQAPTRTHLKLITANGGDIVVEGIDGNMEIGNPNGSITLTGVSGSVVANTVNGNVLATLLRVTAEKAMAFTSLNGSVDVTLPAATRANLKLRSDNGDVYTDFDLSLRTAAEPPVQAAARDGGRFQISVNKSIYGSINGGGPDIELRTFNSNVYARKGK
jgi:hypothetical protein